MGFEFIGVDEKIGYKNNEWYDVKWSQRSLGERTTAPDPPLRISEAREHEQWHEVLTTG